MKKFAIVYASKTASGNTAAAAQRLHTLLGADSQVLFANDVRSAQQLEFADAYIFLSPTVGDEELQDDFEAFFLRFHDDLPRRPFAVCELGNYYGYDDFEFGPASIIRQFLKHHTMKEFVPSLSLDSLPKIPWALFEMWAAKIKNASHDK
jgi:flavodoxin